MRGKVPASVKAAIRKLKTNPECGKLLGGSLAGYRSLRIEDSQKRVIYRVVATGGRSVVEIIAIDHRRDKEVYESAEKRVSN